MRGMGLREELKGELRCVRIFSETRRREVRRPTDITTAGVTAWLAGDVDYDWPARVALRVRYLVLIEAWRVTAADVDREAKEGVRPPPRFVTLIAATPADAIRRAVEFADLWFAESEPPKD